MFSEEDFHKVWAKEVGDDEAFIEKVDMPAFLRKLAGIWKQREYLDVSGSSGIGGHLVQKYKVRIGNWDISKMNIAWKSNSEFQLLHERNKF